MKHPYLILFGLLLASGVKASEQNNLEITENLLPYNNQLDLRSTKSIRGVVIHCTELPDLTSARDYAERIHHHESGTGNSGHYYIERDGRVHQWVELNRVAHHVAGKNADSIGIELVNLGRYPDWHHSEHQRMTQRYPAEQIQALIALLNKLESELSDVIWITGHQDLDQRLIPASDHPQTKISRKLDPGPMFPWSKVLAATQLQRVSD